MWLQQPRLDCAQGVWDCPFRGTVLDRTAVLFGKGGLLARELVPALTRAGWQVVAVAHAECDVTRAADVDAVVARSGATLVVNAAAYTLVDQAEREPEKAFSVNADGAGHVARAAARAGARLLHISTDYVFDGRKQRPYTEHDSTTALGVYARSKLAGEQAVASENSAAYVVRTGELYGDGGRNFFTIILGRARRGEPLRVVNDQVVSPTWTRELAAQLALLIEYAPPGLYHATASGETSWYDAACMALRLARLDAPIEGVSTEAYGSPTPRPRYSILAHNALDTLGLYRMRPWDQALSDWLAHAEI